MVEPIDWEEAGFEDPDNPSPRRPRGPKKRGAVFKVALICAVCVAVCLAVYLIK